ncbi:ABC transporter ATP-binding protein [Streptomyces sp. NPDC056437]|uniref:ABC transporter ATP-binding protein n=1 Tax=Streptomyces sp. NPDC056437 TaxID=3345816 RepID=UPI0036927D44
MTGASTITSPNAPLLFVDHVTQRYGHLPAALDDVTLTVGHGETVGLVGESGSGKSTLARLALGLIAPTSGTVRFANHDPYRLRGRTGREVRARLQFVPQHPRGSLNPALRAGDAVAFTLRVHGMPRHERGEAVDRLFRSVGLNPSLARRRPRELSGGQLQRVAVARALATTPDLIVCDEPTSALDRSTQHRILDLLAEMRERTGVGFLFISHDLAVVRQLADRVLVLRRGRVVEQGPADRLWDDPRHPYTRALLAAATGGPVPTESTSDTSVEPSPLH